MVKVLGFPIQGSWVENSSVAPKSTQPFFFLRSTKWAPGSPRDWVLKSKSWTLSIKGGCKVFFFKVKVLNWTWLTDPVMYGYKKNLVWPPARQTKGCVTNFYAQIWVMGFCVLYYQTIIFTGVYQRWTTYALKPKSVSEMHFRANSKKTQSLCKNGCRQKCLDKSLYMQIYVYVAVSIARPLAEKVTLV